jgi:hypothetical protein
MNTPRPLRSVPWRVWGLLWFALGGQVWWQSNPGQAPAQEMTQLPAPPGSGVLRIASLGEPAAMAKLLMLWLQSFDLQAGRAVAYRQLNYHYLAGWLETILLLDDKSQYPLLMASRVYAEVPDPPRQRYMLEFVYQQYLRDPARRWQWLAHASVLARHRLQDYPLALKYARALSSRATPDMPAWTLDMPAFVLEKMGELEQARIVIGGLLSGGKISDPNEIRFLEEKLAELENKR